LLFYYIWSSLVEYWSHAGASLL